MPLGSGEKPPFQPGKSWVGPGLEVSGYVEGTVVHEGFLGVSSARAQLWPGSGPVGGSQVLEIMLEGGSVPTAPCGFLSVAPGPAA